MNLLYLGYMVYVGYLGHKGIQGYLGYLGIVLSRGLCGQAYMATAHSNASDCQGPRCPGHERRQHHTGHELVALPSAGFVEETTVDNAVEERFGQQSKVWWPYWPAAEQLGTLRPSLLGKGGRVKFREQILHFQPQLLTWLWPGC